MNIAPLVEDTRVTPDMVNAWLGESDGLTAYGKKRKRDVAAHLSVILEDLHEELGRSVVMDMWVRLMVDRHRGELAPFVEPEFGGFLTQDELNSRLGSGDQTWEQGIYETPHEAFTGMRGRTSQVTTRTGPICLRHEALALRQHQLSTSQDQRGLHRSVFSSRWCYTARTCARTGFPKCNSRERRLG